MNKVSKKILIGIEYLIFFVILIIVCRIWYQLFLNQAYGDYEYFDSDMPAYVRWINGTETAYVYPYPIYFIVGKAVRKIVIHSEVAMALATVLLNAFAVVITKLSISFICFSKDKNDSQETGVIRETVLRLIITAATFILFFASMLKFEWEFDHGIRFQYVGIFSPTPWQNGTYIAARPFAILAFLLFAKLLDTYEEKGDWKRNRIYYILFSASMLLATMTKPSYTLVHVSMAGLLMLYRLIKSKFKTINGALILGACYIPTFADLLYQYKDVFSPGGTSEGGIGFSKMYVWSMYTDNIWLAILLAIGFPLFVLVSHIKQLKTNTVFRFSWMIYLMGLFQAVFLYEKGFRDFHFNFAWGYMSGMFCLFLASVIEVMKDTKTVVYGTLFKEGFSLKKCIYLVVFLCEWILLLMHFKCGVEYFNWLAAGHEFR